MNVRSFRVRPATAGDSGAIRKLVYQTGINPTGLDWHRFTVAVSEAGEVVGCGQIKPHRDGSRELASIAVQPPWRLQGVARAVIEDLIGNASQAVSLSGSAFPGLYLVCREELGAFYAKFGFRAIPEAEMPPHFKHITRLFRTLVKVSRIKEGLLVMHLEGGSGSIGG